MRFLRSTTSNHWHRILVIPPSRPNTTRWSSTKSSNPLRILFCGSDHFSAASLRALHQEQRSDPDGIKSIDVLCRPGKRTGRSLKQFTEVPIKSVAEDLGLCVHQRDTFTGWNLPSPDGEPINLIIAVSFGLFVPPRILRSAQYGGLNVHPSLLPNFRGAAPLQWTIMTGHNQAGVTLQTLHDKSFDHGKILLQTPPIDIEPLSGITYSALLQRVTPRAADLLAQGIRDRIFIPPLNEIIPEMEQDSLVHARKLTSKDTEIDWSQPPTRTVLQHNALGPLWSLMSLGKDKRARIKVDGLVAVPPGSNYTTKPIYVAQALKSDSTGMGTESSPTGEALLGCVKEDDGSIVVFKLESRQDEHLTTSNGSGGLRVKTITIEGRAKMAATLALDLFTTNVKALGAS